jgi:Ca-activated chloride channel family protein
MTKSNALPLLEEGSYLSQPPRDDAGFGALETARGRLPLAALDVRARIDGLLAQVVMRQTFVNVTQEPLEATYIFPLPDRAAATAFRMEVAGRVIDGVLKERGQARRDYDQAIRHGHRATIAEEERPGVFTLRVGNLMPGDRATVELTMAGTLPYVDGEVTFRFPLVVAPRYIPGMPLGGPSVGDGTAVDTDTVPDASRISPPVLLPGFPNPVQLSLAVDLHDSGVPAEDIRVSLHATSDYSSSDECVHRIILKPGARLDRDFILRYRLGGAAVRTTLSLHPDAGSPVGGEGTFALTIVPPLLRASEVERPSSRPRDLAFLLDRSGSMEGWKMVAARRAMAQMIDTLTEADRFLLLAFDDRIETPGQVESGLIPATDHNRFRASEFLAKLDSRGGTEIAQPLWMAVDYLEKAGSTGDRWRQGDRDQILVLVTDGQVGNEDHVLATIGPRLGNIRVFTLGIDQAVNEGFLRRLAGLGSGGGSCELVESNDRLDAMMDSIHRRIDTPVFTNVTLESGHNELQVIADSLVPERPPSVFGGSPLLVLGRYRGNPQHPLRLRATTNEGVAYSEAIKPVVRDNPAIAAAWARGQVRCLEDRYAAGLGDRAALERTIIATSLRFGVLCRFTAYVAVDRAATVNEGGEAHQITQPVEVPAGWGAAPASLGRSLMRGYVGSASPFRVADLCLAARSSSSPLAAEMLDEMSARPCASPPSVPPEGSGASFSRARSQRPPAKQTPRSEQQAGPPPPPAVPNASELVRQAGYTLLEETGRDDHGVVHKAHDRSGKLMSVRLLKNPYTTGDSKKCARLERKLKALLHPGIVPILSLIAEPSGTGRVVAIVSEYAHEPSLEGWLASAGPIEPLEIARLVLALAEALQYAARSGVIHGHLTPARIHIGAQVVPRIEDFGLASLGCGPLGSEGSGGGSDYIAPELRGASAVPATQRADIYSLGAILRLILTGQPAIVRGHSGSGRATAKSRSREPFWKAAGSGDSQGAVNPPVPAELQAICARATEPDPSARYASCAQFMADIRKVLGIKQPGWFSRARG